MCIVSLKKTDKQKQHYSALHVQNKYLHASIKQRVILFFQQKNVYCFFKKNRQNKNSIILRYKISVFMRP